MAKRLARNAPQRRSGTITTVSPAAEPAPDGQPSASPSPASPSPVPLAPGSRWRAIDLAGLLAAGAKPRELRAAMTICVDLEHYQRTSVADLRAAGARTKVSPVNVDLGQCWALPLGDPRYPAALAATSAPPVVLFGLGDPAALAPGVAVIGSRNISDYGAAVTETAAATSVKIGASVSSGFAYGVDTLAHTVALRQGGTTVAVLPVAADSIYPTGNRQLLEALLSSGGAVVSEHLPGTVVGQRGYLEYKGNPPAWSKITIAQSLMARNRITVGLSAAVVCAEAAAGSGTLHGVWAALSAGRPIIVALQRPGSTPRPGSAVPSALANPAAAGSLELGPPVSLRPHLEHLAATGQSAASAVARDRSELITAVAAAWAFSPWVDPAATAPALDLLRDEPA